MTKDVRVRLEWILRAMDRVAAIVTGLDVPAFRAGIDKQWLIERGLEIISEATRHIPAERLARHPDIDWRRVRGIGNRLRRGYDQVDAGITFTIATQRLPELRPVIEAMLADLDNNQTT